MTLWEQVEEAFDEESEKCSSEHELTSVAVKRILKTCLKIICEYVENS